MALIQIMYTVSTEPLENKVNQYTTEKHQSPKNCKTPLNALYYTLDANEFNRISACEIAIEVWNILVIAYKSVSYAKQLKICIQYTNMSFLGYFQVKVSKRCASY